MLTNLLIVFFCLTALFGGYMVLFAQVPSRNLFGLFITALSVGVLFLLLGGEFISMAQLIVYAGAILMLFLFVVRYFGKPGKTVKIGWQNPLAYLAGLILFTQLIIPLFSLMKRSSFDKWGTPPDVATIGEILFTKYLFQFELTGVLLLVAVVGAIYMAREEKQGGEK